MPGGMLTLPPGEHVIDTDRGTIDDAPPPAGVTTSVFSEMRVFAMGGLSVNGDVVVVGSLPLVLLVDGDASIVGSLDASAGCHGGIFDPSCAGPGGGVGGREVAELAGGCGAGQPGFEDQFVLFESGGGGGGYGQSGANSGGSGVGAGAGGTPCGPSTIEPLLGGSGGGAGGINETTAMRVGGRGGGGGGAIQVTASGTLSVVGDVAAEGAGGENGSRMGMTAPYGGGGGGGAGGGVILEANLLSVTGSVTANGGGGGGNSLAASGGDGANGRRDRACALGGIAEPGHSPGGRGGCAQQGPGTGGTGGDRGGGGGGFGRIRFNRLTGSPGGVVSPNESVGTPPVE